ncbi:RagB/SusD family nutrient uptake outer membrane protein [Parapedobacter deserti]|uniref:RagB/SusD family nutrient uptake outer membrane protein n=1 Tax=Parapedobacter deserti TaxID=1912957 RepID=A0ABV7JIQ6_9SPHI
MKKLATMICFACLLMITACEKDFLEKQPDENLDIERIFSERKFAEGFLSSVYHNIPPMQDPSQWVQRNPFTGASDEMEITWTGAYSHLLNSGAWSPADFEPDLWGFMYEGIRKANLFLENVDRVPMDEIEKNRWKGEATFLRAFYHFQLVRMYGAIPLVDHSIGLADDWSVIRRQPVDQVINFIADECDKAVALLDWTVPPIRYGRITKPASLALKAQALLYLASPLFNGNPDYAGLVDDQGIRLFPDYDANRWRIAAEAAKACIDGAEANGYGLYYAANNDPVRNYSELFFVRNNREVLMARNNGVHAHFERCANPTGFGGFSIYCPTQELVDAYEMSNGQRPITGYNADGSPIVNPESGYVETGFTADPHPAGYHTANVSNMYANRDPRFYASISFSGAIWKDRPIEFWFTGIDGRQRAGSDYCISGYLMRKMVDPTSNIPQGQFGLNTWVQYRLGEQYLNYAEALNEADGPVRDVYHHVNAIRSRAGMPALPQGMSKEEMRDHIRHERRIELAFEAHRYFDTRRWKIAEVVDGREVHGMNILAGTHLQDEAFYQRTVIERRVFTAPKHYLWPIQIMEIEKNPRLVQNVGW